MVLVPSLSQGSRLEFAQQLWGPLYEVLLGIAGTTYTILPIGDPLHGQPDATTFKGVGGEQQTFTWSKAPDSWDNALDLRKDSSWRGIIPIVHFDGTDEEADTPDAAFWTRASGAWTSVFWVRPDVVNAAMSFLSRYDGTTSAESREWDVGMNSSGQPYIHVWDESANAKIGRLDGTSLVASQWQCLGFVDDGSDVAGALDVYLNGAVVDDTDDDTGSHLEMEGTANTTKLGFRIGASANEQFFNGQMAGGPLGPLWGQTALGADAMLRIYEVGRRALAL